MSFLVVLRDVNLEVLYKFFGLLALLLDVKENGASLGDPVYCFFYCVVELFFPFRLTNCCTIMTKTLGRS